MLKSVYIWPKCNNNVGYDMSVLVVVKVKKKGIKESKEKWEESNG